MVCQINILHCEREQNGRVSGYEQGCKGGTRALEVVGVSIRVQFPGNFFTTTFAGLVYNEIMI